MVELSNYGLFMTNQGSKQMPVTGSGNDNYIAQLLMPTIAAILGALARFLSQPKKHSIWTMLRGMVLAILLALAVSQVCQHYEFSQNMTAVCIGLAGFYADDLIPAMLKLGAKFKQNPTEFIKSILPHWWKK